MMRRNVGQDHWWRSTVLTAQNNDTDAPPIFEDERAAKIFEEFITRGLLVQRSAAVDGSGQPAYAMKYDIEGWDKAVSDGRPVYGLWLKVKRSWLLILITFLLGCVLTTVENRVVGFVDGLIDGRTAENGEPDGPANGSQPIRSETNSTSSAAGSRR